MITPKILVAGIGNVFRGDDGVGVEVARRLRPREGVRIVDFGIRGFDLALALGEPWELVVLVDAARRGGAPGTVYLLEADTATPGGAPSFDAHGMDPAQVLRNARAMGAAPGRVLVVGVEPESFGDPETGRMGLSAPVEAAVAEAVALVESLAKGSAAHA